MREPRIKVHIDVLADKWRSAVRQVSRHVDRAVPRHRQRWLSSPQLRIPSNLFGCNGRGTRAMHSVWIVGRRTFAFLG